ncbi:hypothetical protein CM15mP94_0460 [bacterium]|nr:MAG: hypothetical protein CM15mP94_0460 [bacterium]
MIKKSYIISIVVIVSFLGISATWVISKANESINELPAVIKKVPDFSMTSHIGENFNQDSLLNKISIIDFIFTSCPGPCPIMSSNMRTLYRQYKLHPRFTVYFNISRSRIRYSRSFKKLCRC